MKESPLDALERRRQRRVDSSTCDYLFSQSTGGIPVTKSRHASRRQYVNLGPNATLYDQDLASCLRRFSPNGRFLIGFGRSSHSVCIYDVIYNSAECTWNSSSTNFFLPRHEIMICAGTENICRDFCLFAPESNYMVIASAESCNNFETNPGYTGIAGNTNPHSLHETGKVSDVLKYSNDYILLANHAGVAMIGAHLAILSIQHQLISRYRLDLNNGKFVPESPIGYILCSNDFIPESTNSSDNIEGGEIVSRPLLGFRQKLMSFLFKRALESENSQYSIRLLYGNWDILENLSISKMQYLDLDHLLLKLVCPDSLFSRTRSLSDGGTQNTAFFVVFDITQSTVKSFHRVSSNKFFEIFRDYNDYLKVYPNGDGDGGICWQSSPATDIFDRQCWDRNVQLLSASRPSHGEGYASKRLLSSLPYSVQSISDSPFLDPGIFRYDEKVVSPSERQRSASEFPVRFFSRLSDSICFRLDTGSAPESTFSASNNPYRVKYIP